MARKPKGQQRRGAVSAARKKHEKRAPQLFLATVETTNFYFEAFGRSESAARQNLVFGLRRHAASHQVDKPGAWVVDVMADVKIRLAADGICYRDREKI